MIIVYSHWFSLLSVVWMLTSENVSKPDVLASKTIFPSTYFHANFQITFKMDGNSKMYIKKFMLSIEVDNYPIR